MNIVSKAVYTFNGKVWRHNLNIPEGRTIIPLDNVISSIMTYPTVKDLIGSGIDIAKNIGAKYIVFGRTSDLPFVVTECLKNNIIPLRPLNGKSMNDVNSLCAYYDIEYDHLEYEVDGELVEHDFVTSEY